MPEPSYSDGCRKVAHAYKSRQRAPAAHHPHRIFGTVGNTDNTSGDAHAPVGFARQAHHGVDTAFSVSRNSFVRFSSMPITADYFAFIVANTTNPVGFS
ncbi:hypothetical protein [Microcoleus sp. F4-D5]|uniref:hypothetical protein n=1 Tax=Microcoleus sp. F4-D5 TaxID=2818760 RepID=UPI002FD6C481